MRFKYVGPQEAVDLPTMGVTVRRNVDEVEVTGEQAKEFQARDDWRRTDEPKPRTPTEEPAPEEPAPVEGGEV